MPFEDHPIPALAPMSPCRAPASDPVTVVRGMIQCYQFPQSDREALEAVLHRLEVLEEVTK